MFNSFLMFTIIPRTYLPDLFKDKKYTVSIIRDATIIVCIAESKIAESAAERFHI